MRLLAINGETLPVTHKQAISQRYAQKSLYTGVTSTEDWCECISLGMLPPDVPWDPAKACWGACLDTHAPEDPAALAQVLELWLTSVICDAFMRAFTAASENEGPKETQPLIAFCTAFLEVPAHARFFTNDGSGDHDSALGSDGDLQTGSIPSYMHEPLRCMGKLARACVGLCWPAPTDHGVTLEDVCYLVPDGVSKLTQDIPRLGRVLANQVHASEVWKRRRMTFERHLGASVVEVPRLLKLQGEIDAAVQAGWADGEDKIMQRLAGIGKAVTEKMPAWRDQLRPGVAAPVHPRCRCEAV